jgi:hypothetical protein
MQDRDEPFDQLPPAIVEALRELDGPAVMPDPEDDAELLSGARRHLAQAITIERNRRRLRLFFAGGTGGAIAAAAMVAFVVFLGNPGGVEEVEQYAASTPPDRVESSAEITGDLDFDGRLDILDAYVLASQIEQGLSSSASDFNRDGRVDQADIDWIALRAVALSAGERG